MLQKLVLHIPRYEWAMIVAFARKALPKEIGWLSRLVPDNNVFTLQGVDIIDQEISTGEVNLDPKEKLNWLKAAFTPDRVLCKMPQVTYLQGHSHGSMATFFSSQDDKWRDNYVNRGLLFELCVNAKGEHTSRCTTLVGDSDDENKLVKVAVPMLVEIGSPNYPDLADLVTKLFDKHVTESVIVQSRGGRVIGGRASIYPFATTPSQLIGNGKVFGTGGVTDAKGDTIDEIIEAFEDPVETLDYLGQFKNTIEGKKAIRDFKKSQGKDFGFLKNKAKRIDIWKDAELVFRDTGSIDICVGEGNALDLRTLTPTKAVCDWLTAALAMDITPLIKSGCIVNVTDSKVERVTPQEEGT